MIKYKHMANTIKKERNQLIIKLKDERGWSFSSIAKELGLKAKSSAYEAYINEKKRSAVVPK